MAEIINLNKARKARAKLDKAARATENRTVFGRTRADKAQAETRKATEAARLEGHRLDPSEPE